MTFNQELIFSLEDLAAYESRPSRVVNLMLQTGEKPYLPTFFFFIYEPRNPQGDEDWEDTIISARTKRIRCSLGREAVLERGEKKKS